MWSRAVILTFSMALAVGVGGCTGDDSDPKSSPTAGSSATPSESPSSDAPSVTPADGPPLDGNALSLHLYASPDWEFVTTGSTKSAGLLDDTGTPTITISDLATTATTADLDADAVAAEKGLAGDNLAPRRVENRTVNGVECWVLAGEDEKNQLYVVGGIHRGYQFSITFDLPADWAEADQRIEEVLASVEWK